MRVVDAAWQEWLSSNVARGCTPGSMIDAMVQAGFAGGDARVAVHHVEHRRAHARLGPVHLEGVLEDHESYHQ